MSAAGESITVSSDESGIMVDTEVGLEVDRSVQLDDRDYNNAIFRNEVRIVDGDGGSTSRRTTRSAPRSVPLARACSRARA